MSLPVRTTPEADAQIRDIDDWWRKNRRSSPNLFLEELAASLEVIVVLPLGTHEMHVLLPPRHRSGLQPHAYHALG